MKIRPLLGALAPLAFEFTFGIAAPVASIVIEEVSRRALRAAHTGLRWAFAQPAPRAPEPYDHDDEIEPGTAPYRGERPGVDGRPAYAH